MRSLYLDVATAPLENAADFITTDDIQAPSNYVKPEAIAGYVQKEVAKRLERAALDPDCCRLTAIGTRLGESSIVLTCRTEDSERDALETVANILRTYPPSIVSFNGFKFDLPVLMRRAQYLGVLMPELNLDRYRSPHVDLYDRLTYRGAITGHALSWYVKRHGWTDLVKPLSGAEEALVPQTGRWDELELSVRHDLTATERIAKWLRIVPELAPALVEEPIL